MKSMLPLFDVFLKEIGIGAFRCKGSDRGEPILTCASSSSSSMGLLQVKTS